MKKVILSQKMLIDFVLKEWLVVVSGVGLFLTSLYTKELPVYSVQELEVLFILFALFVGVNGLHNSGLILNIAQRIEKGKFIPLKLVTTTFFLSMVVTNDVALIVMVPLTLSLNINRKGILVILETLAVNGGSALTPIGNPQNLFIYWFYGVQPLRFIETITPFSIIFLIILTVLSLFINISNNTQKMIVQKINWKAYIYVFLIFIVLLAVFRVIFVGFCAFVVIFAVIFDKKSLKVDYALLLTFFFFFGLVDDIKLFFASKISYPEHVFLFSALASQLMSNVPAALLFAKFTTNWKSLLWGVNTGGFGSLFGSLANLIAYRLYVTWPDTKDSPRFTVLLLVFGYVSFFLSVALYFFLSRVEYF